MSTETLGSEKPMVECLCGRTVPQHGWTQHKRARGRHGVINDIRAAAEVWLGIERRLDGILWLRLRPGDHAWWAEVLHGNQVVEAADGRHPLAALRALNDQTLDPHSGHIAALDAALAARLSDPSR